MIGVGKSWTILGLIGGVLAWPRASLDTYNLAKSAFGTPNIKLTTGNELGIRYGPPTDRLKGTHNFDFSVWINLDNTDGTAAAKITSATAELDSTSFHLVATRLTYLTQGRTEYVLPSNPKRENDSGFWVKAGENPDFKFRFSFENIGILDMLRSQRHPDEIVFGGKLQITLKGKNNYNYARKMCFHLTGERVSQLFTNEEVPTLIEECDGDTENQ